MCLPFSLRPLRSAALRSVRRYEVGELFSSCESSIIRGAQLGVVSPLSGFVLHDLATRVTTGFGREAEVYVVLVGTVSSMIWFRKSL